MKGDVSQFEEFFEQLSFSGLPELSGADIDRLKFKFFGVNIISRALVLIKAAYEQGKDITDKKVIDQLLAVAAKSSLLSKKGDELKRISLEDMFFFDVSCQALINAQVLALTKMDNATANSPSPPTISIPVIKTDLFSLITRYAKWAESLREE